mmetsp:Transcript_112557/g.319147  ORF Transcript_112557/g.319147 Transcript_112557/m.319147 type:complete len:185 (-) Transcript_112557:146-700(-)
MAARTGSALVCPGGQLQGARRRKIVSFDTAPQCFAPRASPVDATAELVQALLADTESDSDVSMGSPAEFEVQLGAPAVLPDDTPDSMASSVFSDADAPPGAQQEDDVELAEIEAFADEQARRFMPLVEKRRARRTATISIGRAKQADGITFQLKTSALWQRRGAAGCSLAVPGRARCSVLGAAM